MFHGFVRRMLLIAALVVVFPGGRSVQAGGVVTTCDWPSLQAALAGGGTVTFQCSGTIIMPETTISIDTMIDGNGYSVTLSGNEANRVLIVLPGITLNLKGVAIAHGRADGGWGGGLYNAGSTIITDSQFSGNSARWGGGLVNAGSMTITDSSFTGNTATQDGGGLYSSGTLTLARSTLADNTAGACCGGVAVSNGTVHISNSTLHRNNSGGPAGGVGRFGPDTTVTITASTVTDNTTSGAGGGLWNAFHPGPLTIRNTIVANNSAGVGPDCKKPFEKWGMTN